jgi:hypothetical protein
MVVSISSVGDVDIPYVLTIRDVLSVGPAGSLARG